jgi:type I site-specific restriction-modification system R (restriction) subunit
VGATVGHAERSGDLRKFIEAGKKIIISTVQKFPFILDEIGNEQRGRRFAIIIDEAHSSQGGKTSAAMAQALSKAGEEGEDETYEDQINRLMASRKLLPNASYFAFTATPKNKTLEIFGAPTAGGGHKPEPELDHLSNILKAFNDQFGNISWEDADRVHQLITQVIPARVAADSAYRNAQRNSDKQNARIEHDKALVRVMTSVMKDDTELFKQFMDNEGFKRWLTDTVFDLTYERGEV